MSKWWKGRIATILHGISSNAEDKKAFNMNLPTEAETSDQCAHVLLWENNAITVDIWMNHHLIINHTCFSQRSGRRDHSLFTISYTHIYNQFKSCVLNI